MNAAGFGIYPAVFSQAEIRGLSSRIEAQTFERSRAGARHVLRHEPIAALATDPRLSDLAGKWLGSPATPFKATLFEKTADANWLVAWHQDTALPMAGRKDVQGWGPWSEKHGVTYAHAPAGALERIIALRIHLDDSTPQNGPLRVLPGTHLQGVLSDAQVHAQSQEIQAVECCVGWGGVVAMRPLLIHASSKLIVDAPRRVLHLEYAASLELDQGLSLRAA